MQASAKGLIDIIGHESICTTWYYDSKNVPTIGIGETHFDGINPQTYGEMPVDKAIERFKTIVIKPYADAVDEENTYHNNGMSQQQYDALLSACYNFGEGNLHQLCRHRTLVQIGDALMLYTRPPEITSRRRAEQTLYKTGQYANTSGHVLVFPVTASRHPDYHRGRMIDVRPYFQPSPLAPPVPV